MMSESAEVMGGEQGLSPNGLVIAVPDMTEPAVPPPPRAAPTPADATATTTGASHDSAFVPTDAPPPPPPAARAAEPAAKQSVAAAAAAETTPTPTRTDLPLPPPATDGVVAAAAVEAATIEAAAAAAMAAARDEDGLDDGEFPFPVVYDCEHNGCVRAIGITLGGTLLSAGFDSMLAMSPRLKRHIAGGASLTAAPSASLMRGVHGDARIFAMDVHESGESMVTGSADGAVKIWSTDPNALPATAPVLRRTMVGHGKSGIRTVQIGPRWIASAGGGGLIRVWSLADGEPLPSISAHGTADINSLAVSPDGSMMSSASSDGSVRVWSMPEGTLKHKLIGHTGVVVSAGIIPGLDGGPDQLISASCDRTVRTWDLGTGKQLCVFEGHTSNVSQIWDPDFPNHCTHCRQPRPIMQRRSTWDWGKKTAYMRGQRRHVVAYRAIASWVA